MKIVNTYFLITGIYLINTAKIRAGIQLGKNAFKYSLFFNSILALFALRNLAIRELQPGYPFQKFKFV